ncbi:MAG TPA: transporter substrate-binding domain-containing protein, partial [Mariprofundaceae bacterium]|nr:transporter substrate-binding domain-containing protein [Mariprofundaceae bacterium]
RQSDIQVYHVDTVMDGLKAVVEEDADAVVADVGTLSYLIREYGLATLRVSGFADIPVQGFSMGVRKDWPELVGILDKALMAIPDQRHQQVLKRWIEAEQEKYTITMNEREKAFIRQHPAIRLGIDPEFAPFEFMEDGTYKGMASDYVKLLNERLGLNMEIVKGQSWKEAVAGIKDGKIDVLPCVGITEERKGFLNYTRSYINFHRVIITRIDMPFITGVDDIAKLKVAVQANSSHAGYLKDYTNIIPMTFATLRQSLLALSDGKVDAFIGNVASSTYWIRKMNLTNLKIAAPVSQEVQGLHFAVRKDWPELIGILQKGLDSISDKQRKEISEKWLLLKYDPVTDYALIGKLSLGFIALLLVVGLWNLQIRRQKKALEVAKREALTANRELTRMHEELESLVEIRTAELQESEKSFRQAQKMEALGTLVGGIAHDFNNMLAGMLGSTYLAKQATDNPKKVSRSLTMIEDLGYRAADMIKQLLAFSRQEEVDKSILLLNPFYKEAFKLIRIGVEEGVHLNSEITDEEMAVHANSTQLQQCLFNLVNNAKYAVANEEHPEITVCLYRYEADKAFIGRNPDYSQGDSFAVMEVRDNGEGIPAENIDQLFDPFFTTKPVDKGTGLGLAMVYGTVKDHGGVLEVESEVGKGSCFRVYLPLDERGVAHVERESEQVQPGSGETILLVDDDLPLQTTIRMILSEIGYRVEVASNGREAVDIFAANPAAIDLVLTDVVMPDMGGPEAVKEMRRINPQLRVVYLSGYDSRGGLADQLKQSHETLLSKPCSVGQLSRVIREKLS